MIDRDDLEEDQTLSLIISILPDTIEHWSLDYFLEWFEKAKLLLIIDDFLPSSAGEEKLLSLLSEWENSDVLLLINNENVSKVLSLVDPVRSVVFFRFEKLTSEMQNNVLDFIAKQNNMNTSEEIKNVMLYYKNIDTIFDTFGGIQFYFHYVKQFHLTFSKDTVSNFIWEIIFHIWDSVRMSESVSSDKINQWLTMTGQTCHECLVERVYLQGKRVNPFVHETKFIFHDILDYKLLIHKIMSLHYSLYQNEIVYSITHQKIQEFLTAFYLLKKNLEGVALKRMVKKLKNDDEIVVYVAGLLALFFTDEKKSFEILQKHDHRREKRIERVLKNLAYHVERAYEPITFIFRVLHELKCHQNLVEGFLQDYVYPAHLHVHDVGIYADAMNEMLKRSLPDKVHLLIRRNYKIPEIIETLNVIKRFNVNLALAETNHLDWKSSRNSSEIVKSISYEGVATLQDFIGCLGRDEIIGLPKSKVTCNIVCLRIRVDDLESALALLETHTLLSSLLWFEVDFDLDFNELIQQKFPPVSAPLIDLSFKEISDENIPQLCDFIYSINPHLSGLHIQRSTITPQGVAEILKYFYKRDMTLHGDKKTILKYRKYRFPEFSTVEPKTELSDQETERLLGYDDRHHYSDNEIYSSCNATLQDVKTLKNFFVLMNILYFTYSCSSYYVKKDSDGEWIVQKRII